MAGGAITAPGCLCYLIPTVGWIAGGIITSAGISGLMEAVTNPDGDNWDFLKSVGIGGLIGALSLGLAHLEIGEKIGELMCQSEKLELLFQYFSKELVQETLAGAISGAAVETANQLVDNGFDLT